MRWTRPETARRDDPALQLTGDGIQPVRRGLFCQKRGEPLDCFGTALDTGLYRRLTRSTASTHALRSRPSLVWTSSMQRSLKNTVPSADEWRQWAAVRIRGQGSGVGGQGPGTEDRPSSRFGT